MEVLLFMAISGLMFIVAANFISGKQARAEFKQGMNTITSELTAVINDVNNGYFPARDDIKCSADDAGGPLIFTGTAKEQGANKGCVFMGKIFGLESGDINNHTYKVYTVAGRQFRGTAAANLPPKGFTEARPAVVPDLTQKARFQWKPELVKMTSKGSAITAVGFFTGFGRDISNLYRENGGTVVVPIPGALGSFQPNSVKANADSSLANGYTALTDSSPHIILCFESGHGEWGTVTLGGDTPGQRSLIKAKIYTEKPGGGIC